MPLVDTLGLWFRGGTRVPATLHPERRPASCMYVNGSISISYNWSDVLEQISISGQKRAVMGRGMAEGMKKLDPLPLDLTLVIHDLETCLVTDDELGGHSSNSVTLSY